MRYQIVIEQRDIDAVHQVMNNHRSHPIVIDRNNRNVVLPLPALSKDNIWWVQIMCLVTTQNKSGAGSPVDKFLSTQPFPLSWQNYQNAQNVNELIETVFSSTHIRRWRISAGFARQNYATLAQGGWDILDNVQKQLLIQRNQAPIPDHYCLERQVAEDIQKLFRGLGPKQSRNFLQDLGLTRYEIPLDSRVMRWVHSNLDFYLPSLGLANERFYCQMMDVLRELALAAGVLPCMLDAAVFASFERQ